MAFHGAVCECFVGAMLEPCLLVHINVSIGNH